MECNGYIIDFEGYEISHGSIDYVLLNACLTLDEARFSKHLWKEFSKKNPEFNLQSQRALHRLLDKIGEAVDLSYQEIKAGKYLEAQSRLEQYNRIGVGLYPLRDIEPAMLMVKDFQNKDHRAGAYDCRCISNNAIYLSVWIDF